MRRVCLPGLAGLVGFALLAGSSFASDQAPTTKSNDQPTTTKSGVDNQKHKANKPVASEGLKSTTSANETKQTTRTHLPAGFGHLNMTAEQHQQASAIMEKYSSQMKQLETQLRDLRTKRDGELNALLSETQKKSFAEAKTNAQRVRQERRATRVSTSSNPKMKEVQEAFKARQAAAQKAVAAEIEGSKERANKAKTTSTTGSKETTKEQSKEQSKEQPSQTEKQPEKK